MDSINSYDGSRNGLDDGQDQGEITEMMTEAKVSKCLWAIF